MTFSHVGLLCSGGDSPGMNCAIRAVVRTALFNGIQVTGIRRGYAGLLKGEFQLMNLSSVGNIIQRGGTILQTSRCPEFMKPVFRKKAVDMLRAQRIDALIVIGGDGSFNGAKALWDEHQFPVIGIPGTIDNDVSGTEYTIGFDTAVQTAIEAVDRIRDTAHSHARTFLVEVMGRNSSAIALKVGVCTGAENVLLPHEQVNHQKLVDDIQRGMARGKESSIIIVAEGPVSGRSYEIQKVLKETYSMDAHVAILGHVQRGGSPTADDRFIASQMGNMAVQSLMEGKFPCVTVVQHGRVIMNDIANCVTKSDHNFSEYQKLAETLSI
ncbi:MAG TPA: 6-phosphofructokinase [Bacteriovoracaceae bacterium]|nr:6-phosphofructokinase [Bacteriovoracaceae bacterium]